jgi:hypothetical protein
VLHSCRLGTARLEPAIEYYRAKRIRRSGGAKSSLCESECLRLLRPPDARARATFHLTASLTRGGEAAEGVCLKALCSYV